VTEKKQVAAAVNEMVVPLCRRYSVLIIDTINVQMLEGSCLRDLPMRCALGVLADGQTEAIGAWPATASASTDSRQVASELRDRGVEFIQYVLGDTSISKGVRDAFPNAVHVHRTALMERHSTVPRRLVRSISIAEEAVRLLHAVSARSISRLRRQNSVATAAEVFVKELRRADALSWLPSTPGSNRQCWLQARQRN
jgi:hypothetical protein